MFDQIYKFLFAYSFTAPITDRASFAERTNNFAKIKNIPQQHITTWNWPRLGRGIVVSYMRKSQIRLLSKTAAGQSTSFIQLLITLAKKNSRDKLNLYLPWNRQKTSVKQNKKEMMFLNLAIIKLAEHNGLGNVE